MAHTVNFTSEPLVSIIIPTFNSGKTLSLCLRSLMKQSYQNTETIVVDKCSTDNTVQIARDFAVKTINSRARERSEQVNLGVAYSQGKYIYRVDSDVIVAPAVIEQAVKSCEVNGFDGVYVHNTSDPTVSFWAKVRKLERDFYKDDLLNSAARFVRKDAFLKIGGFDEDLVAGEDYDFNNRLVSFGFRIGMIDAQEVHLGEPTHLSETLMKHYYYGKTIRLFIRKNKKKARMQLSPIRAAYFRHSSTLFRDPTLLVGLVLYQSVRYTAALLGYIMTLHHDDMSKSGNRRESI